MGNENSQLQENVNDKNKDESNTEHLNQQKRARPPDKMTNKAYGQFFIQHHKLYNISNVNDLSLLDPRRIVFISIRDLHKSWTHVPSISLYNAIIVVPFKKEWIVSPHKYHHEYSPLLEDSDFLTLLRWKEHQQLAVFMLDTESATTLETEAKECMRTIQTANYDHEHPQPPTAKHSKTKPIVSPISPVWWRLSSLLQTLHDPMRSDKYHPLIFSENYWRNESDVCTETVDEIMKELYTVTMRFKSIKYILSESNHTLNVIVNFSPQQVTKRTDVPNSPNDDEDDSILNSDWWIADDYYEDEDDDAAIQEFEQFVNNIDAS